MVVDADLGAVLGAEDRGAADRLRLAGPQEEHGLAGRTGAVGRPDAPIVRRTASIVTGGLSRHRPMASW